MRRGGRACRYCKSPAWRNPCWWWTDHPKLHGYADAPCEMDDWQKDKAHRDRNALLRALAVAAAIVGAIALAVFFSR